MKPDEKYMSEVKNKNSQIKFVPPSFDRNFFMDNYVDPDDNDALDLYPSETDESDLYCYYNSLNNCQNNNPPKKNSRGNSLPDTFEILKELNFNSTDSERLDRLCSSDDIDVIYSEINSNNPEIKNTFSAYNIPDPIIKVITKDLIKLSLLYLNEK